MHLLVSQCLANRLYGTMKRCVSAVVAAVALCRSPVMALIALSIYMADKGPSCSSGARRAARSAFPAAEVPLHGQQKGTS